MPPAKKEQQRLPQDAYILVIRQAPENGKSYSGKEKDRKPIDPPPIVQLQIRDYSDPAQNYLQSPYYMCVCSLLDAKKDEPPEDPTLVGTLVSSLHRLKDTDNSDAGFFVFPDVSVKAEGDFRLKFTLWELLDGTSVSLQDVTSRPFTIHPAKTFPGLAESTFLTRSFGDQGVRLRIRKETRTSIKRSVSEAENGHYPIATRDQAGLAAVAYGPPSAYHGAYAAEYAQGMVKRQKSAGGQGYPDREGWAYSQPQGSPGVYAHPGGHPVSGYYQEPVSGGPQMEYAFRGPANSEGTMGQQAYYQRPPMEYSHAHSSMPYGGQPRQDPASGMNYPEPTAYSSMPASDAQTKRTDYPTPGSDRGMRSQYPYGAQGGTSVPNTLPPISASASQSAGAPIASPPPYSSYSPADARYSSSGVQGGARPPYGHYPGQAYSIPTNYT